MNRTPMGGRLRTLPALIGIAWIGIAGLLVRIIAGRLTDGWPVDDAGTVLQLGAVGACAVAGLLLATAVVIRPGPRAFRASAAYGACAALFGALLLAMGHESASVIAGLAVVGAWLSLRMSSRSAAMR